MNEIYLLKSAAEGNDVHPTLRERVFPTCLDTKKEGLF